MPIKVLMPALSPTMTEGKLSKWVKKEGDFVKAGDVIAEIETDKAMIEFESTEEGTLGKLLVAEGTEGVKVNDLIAVMLDEGEDASVIDSFVASNSTVSAPVVSTTAPAPVVSAPVSVAPVVNQTVNNTSGRVFITPLAKKIAFLNGLDIAKIKGSGPNGRIVKADVETAMANGTATAGGMVASGKYAKGNSGKFTDKPNSGMRKVIASRLLESKTQIPHYYETIEVKMDALLELRAELNKQGKDVYKLSVNDFIIKATALAMQDVPDANCYWNGDSTRYFVSSDVSVAVATPTGLITPIVTEAEAKSIVEISADMKDLAKRAKEGKLKPSEYQGGGFSISNLGMFGIDEFNAIINPPQAGILAIGATKETVLVKNGQMVIANVMRVTLSADHRVIDGAVAAKFLNAFRKYIEIPALMFYVG